LNFSTVTSSPKYVGGLREIYISIKLSLNGVYNAQRKNKQMLVGFLQFIYNSD